LQFVVQGLGIPKLEETGFYIYDLQRMHDEFSVDYYNKNIVEQDDQVAVLEVDFYRADSFFVYMSNAQVVELTLKAVSAALDTTIIETSETIDSKIIRARNAVSHFAPNSSSYSPSAKLEKGILWVIGWTGLVTHLGVLRSPW
jgi:hypothetical protein